MHEYIQNALNSPYFHQKKNHKRNYGYLICNNNNPILRQELKCKMKLKADCAWEPERFFPSDLAAAAGDWGDTRHHSKGIKTTFISGFLQLQ